MSSTENFGFGKFVPGFDFLQNLTKSAASSNATSQLPSMGGWVAPTMNVEDLDKRIEELKAVQFWLDQNAMALKATIQALEVQKMTLATLKGMNVSMGDLAKAFTLNTAATPVAAPVAAPVVSPVNPVAQFFAAAIAPAAEAPTPPPVSPPVAPPVAAPAVDAAASSDSKIDPMQWWGALTQQFQQIATTVMKDVADKTAAANLAKETLAKDALKAATDMSAFASKTVADGVEAVSAPAKKIASKIASAAVKPPVKAAAKASVKAVVKTAAKKVAQKTTR